MTQEELLNLIPAYAIGALDDDERIALETLLESDAEAQESLQEYEAIAEVFAFAIPERPAPEHLKADLKARLVARPKIVERDLPARTVKPSKEPRLIPLPNILLISAAILVVVIGFGFILTQSTPEIISNEALFTQIIEQDNFIRFDLTPASAENVSGELVVASDSEQAILRIESLPDRSEEESYQLWVIDGDTVQSAGIFYWETGHGPYYIPIERPLSEIGTIAMTIEPFEGSPLENEPTGDILFGVEVSS